MLNDTLRDGGSYAFETAFLYGWELQWATDQGTSWYRSKDKRGGFNPFPSFMMNKKWPLEEQFNNHMMKFQQVTVSSIYFSKLHFDIPGWIVGR